MAFCCSKHTARRTGLHLGAAALVHVADEGAVRLTRLDYAAYGSFGRRT